MALAGRGSTRRPRGSHNTQRRTTRNDELNRSAFRLGRLVGAGELNRDDVEQALLAACDVNGLNADDGERATLRTIASGLTAGMRYPRQRPARGHTGGGRTSKRASAREAGTSGGMPMRRQAQCATRPPGRWLPVLRPHMRPENQKCTSGHARPALVCGSIADAGHMRTRAHVKHHAGQAAQANT